MRGKVTYRHPQPMQYFDHEVAPLPAATMDKLRDALGWPLICQLTPHEHYAAARIVESARFYKDRAHANAADRKATLAALAEEPDDKVLAALDACDPTTRAHVWDGAFIHLEMSAAEFAE